MIQLCSLIILVIIVLILTGYVTPNFNNNGSMLKKEGYGPPPGERASLPISHYEECRPAIASPSKEWLDWFYNGKPECLSKDPKRYGGWPDAPLEFQASTASSISNFIERVA